MIDLENQIKDNLEIQARLKLFSAIEPGSITWSIELKRYGAVELVERIIHGAYEKVNKASVGIRQYSLIPLRRRFGRRLNLLKQDLLHQVQSIGLHL
jgi:hypothetical protein